MRLIDADDLINRLESARNMNCNRLVTRLADVVISIIREIPTAYEIPEEKEGGEE